MFYGMGQDWGRDLRSNAVTWDKFVEMIKVLLTVDVPSRDAFHSGFAAAYGAEGNATFQKAWQEAQGLPATPYAAPTPNQPPATTPNQAPSAQAYPPPTTTTNILPPAVESP